MWLKYVEWSCDFVITIKCKLFHHAKLRSVWLALWISTTNETHAILNKTDWFDRLDSASSEEFISNSFEINIFCLDCDCCVCVCGNQFEYEHQWYIWISAVRFGLNSIREFNWFLCYLSIVEFRIEQYLCSSSIRQQFVISLTFFFCYSTLRITITIPCIHWMVEISFFHRSHKLILCPFSISLSLSLQMSIFSFSAFNSRVLFNAKTTFFPIFISSELFRWTWLFSLYTCHSARNSSPSKW